MVLTFAGLNIQLMHVFADYELNPNPGYLQYEERNVKQYGISLGKTSSFRMDNFNCVEKANSKKSSEKIIMQKDDLDFCPAVTLTSSRGSQMDQVFNRLNSCQNAISSEPYAPTSYSIDNSALNDIEKNRNQCQFCNKTFTRPWSLTRHQSSCQTIQLVTCDFCDQSFSREDNKKAHMQIFHSIGPSLNCPVCQVQFRSKKGLEKHQLICNSSH